MRLAAAMLAALVAAPTLAQPDPIGALIEQGRSQEADPDTAAERPPPPAAEPASPEPSASEAAYERRIRASMAAAAGFQGPLEGGWTLATKEGDLYAFQFVDRGAGGVEGAWRDLRRPGALDGSGYVDEAERLGGEVVLRFDRGRVATLRAGSDGRWVGELAGEGAGVQVTLRRRNP